MPGGRAAVLATKLLPRRRHGGAPRRIGKQRDGFAHGRARVGACTAARASRARRVASAKLYMLGPRTTGTPAASASIRFWPPSGMKLPPMIATSAAP